MCWTAVAFMSWFPSVVFGMGHHVAHIENLGGVESSGTGLLLSTKKLYCVRLGSKRIIWSMEARLLRINFSGNRIVIESGQTMVLEANNPSELEFFAQRFIALKQLYK